jgi:hypothetical protein
LDKIINKKGNYMQMITLINQKSGAVKSWQELIPLQGYFANLGELICDYQRRVE